MWVVDGDLEVTEDGRCEHVYTCLDVYVSLCERVCACVHVRALA